MDSRCLISTDTATLAIFDPVHLDQRTGAECDWWCESLLELDEIQSGSVAIISLGGDGGYALRITDGELASDERDYAVAVVQGLGVEVVSGKLFVGPAECLPGGGLGFVDAETQRGLLLDVEIGQYDLALFAIKWFNAPQWWRDDHSVPEGAPADLVIILRPRLRPFPGIHTAHRLLLDADDFLYESTTRRVGPEPGMILSTQVRKSATNVLCLKECGPCGYRASLDDYSCVAWKDIIRIRVLSVDHDARQLVGEFVEVVDKRS